MTGRYGQGRGGAFSFEGRSAEPDDVQDGQLADGRDAYVLALGVTSVPLVLSLEGTKIHP
jgi:hypothetical protein